MKHIEQYDTVVVTHFIDSSELPEYIVPDDRNQAPSELARVNGFLELETKLRRMEDETMRLPTIFVDKN